jgi:hypothetical protein
MIVFYPTDYKTRLPHHISFQIVVVYAMKSLTYKKNCAVLDEGASTCVKSLACWKVIGQTDLSLSPIFLTTFDN